MPAAISRSVAACSAGYWSVSRARSRPGRSCTPRTRLQRKAEYRLAELRRQLDEREVGFAIAYRTYQTLSRRRPLRAS